MTEEVEKKEIKKTKTRKKYIPVKVIASKKKAIIVEWFEKEIVHRGILPIGTTVKDGKIEEGILNTAIQYGVPWDEFVPGDFDGQKINDLLHQKGIWTYQDAKNNLSMFGRVILQSMNTTRNDLLNFAKQFENKK